MATSGIPSQARTAISGTRQGWLVSVAVHLLALAVVMPLAVRAAKRQGKTYPGEVEFVRVVEKPDVYSLPEAQPEVTPPHAAPQEIVEVAQPPEATPPPDELVIEDRPLGIEPVRKPELETAGSPFGYAQARPRAAPPVAEPTPAPKHLETAAPPEPPSPPNSSPVSPTPSPSAPERAQPPVTMPLDVAEASPRGAPAPVQTALAREPARLKGGLELHYPEAMRRKGETATVLLEVSVDESGKPQTVRLLSEDVASGFASAAIKAVERARFNPAQVNGEPAPDTIRLRVEFRLQ